MTEREKMVVAYLSAFKTERRLAHEYRAMARTFTMFEDVDLAESRRAFERAHHYLDCARLWRAEA